jgi:hypothetical protein
MEEETLGSLLTSRGNFQRNAYMNKGYLEQPFALIQVLNGKKNVIPISLLVNPFFHIS